MISPARIAMLGACGIGFAIVKLYFNFDSTAMLAGYSFGVLACAIANDWKRA